MNRKLLSITVIIFEFALVAYSQNYQSIFGKDSTKWYQTREIIDYVQSIIIQTGNDTLINTLPYTKIIVNDEIEYSYYYLREDTIEGKVWIYDKEDALEYLIMDLSLNVSDTFRMSTVDIFQDSLAIVNSITSENGRKIVELGYELSIDLHGSQLKFIEGVGPTAGLLYQLINFRDNTVSNNLLLCTYKDGSQDYFLDEPYNNNCYFVGGSGIFGNSDKALGLIYPDPANNEITIEFEENYSGNLMVLNILGQIMSSLKIETTNKVVLDINDLAAGMYYIALSDSTDILKIGKFYKK